MTALTAQDFHIGVCRSCGRYGQLSKDGRVCALAEPVGLVDKDFYRRTRACARIAKRRADRGRS
ncbi:MAG TPA: hypothetical protein VNT52_02270 [Acidimicrobiales bacterium]|nr:hypothetical protein [Acidimicrobiales bacterium]